MHDKITISSQSGRVHGSLETGSGTGAPIVLLFHGIFVTRSENGRFDRLAPRLSAQGMDSLRIDLSGHGASEVPSRDARVARMATELLDAMTWVRDAGYSTTYVVASSFSGALTALALTSPISDDLMPSKLVFLNPVLDFNNVFTHAALPEMAAIFTLLSQENAFRDGSFQPTDTFTMSREFLLELHNIDVPSAYLRLRLPHLVLHGDADELVSYQRTAEIVAANPAARFETVQGGVHAFTQSGHEARVWDRAIEWLQTT